MGSECDFGKEVKPYATTDGGAEGEKEVKSVTNGSYSETQVAFNGIFKLEDAGSAQEQDSSQQKLISKDSVTADGVWTSAGNGNGNGNDNDRPGLNTTVTPPAKLTIFYAGSVRVFDAISAEKAREIMLFASTIAAFAGTSSEAKDTGINCLAPSPALTRSPSLQSTTASLASPEPHQLLCKLRAEFPIERKRSLQQFFEKRRDRLLSKNPYIAPTTIKKTEHVKTNFGPETSTNGDCLEKTPMHLEEALPNAIIAHYS